MSAVSSASAAVSANSAKKCHWYLQFEEPPVTAELREGPIPFDFLAEQLILEDDAVSPMVNLCISGGITELVYCRSRPLPGKQPRASPQSDAYYCGSCRMRSEEGYQMRIYSAGDVAFLFKPIILQGPSGTYLIGWADKQYAQGLEMWAQEAKDLHMFFFPATEKVISRQDSCPSLELLLTIPPGVWLALHGAAHRQFCANCVNLGETRCGGKFPCARFLHELILMAAQDKQHLLEELQERNPTMDVAAFKRDVRNGQLVQCCIQIESKHRREESLEFMRDYGLVGGDARAVAEEDW